MNCIFILLLLCCCGKGNCGNLSDNCGCNKSCNDRDYDNSCRKHDHDDSCRKHDYDEPCREHRDVCDEIRDRRDGYNRDDKDCSCNNNDYGRTERYVAPSRMEFSVYGRDDNYDRREGRCETCGCETDNK